MERVLLFMLLAWTVDSAVIMNALHGVGTSPLIAAASWGQIRVDGLPYVYKDCKLFPGGSSAWDWGVTGTHHVPGVQPADLKEIVDRGVSIIVISQGMRQALQVPDSTISYLQTMGIQAIVLPTQDAVEEYNALAGEGRRVGAILHSTC